ncbi:MAG: diguanylate cyclase [Motiliproteus sp.]|nr:diguanylate cyclase [Motiliproteus sp.]
MNIGTSLELCPMVRQFMKTCIRRLSLRRIHLYMESGNGQICAGEEYAVSDNHFRFSMPSSSTNQSSDEIAVSYLNYKRPIKATLVEDSNGVLLHAFPMAGVGLIIMERLNIPLQTDLLEALTPIIKRFKSSCEAAIQHEHLTQEINRRQKAEQHIEHLAYHDDLTGLPNRRSFTLKLDQMIQQAKETGWQGVLLYVDLDNFRDINESLGYAVGDAVLRSIALRLENAHYKNLSLSRTAGDSFGILLPLFSGSEQELKKHALEIAKSVQATIDEPTDLENLTLSVSASIGIVTFSGKGVDGGMLLAQGSVAMYQAKLLGRSTLHFFDPNMANATEKRLILDAEMRAALREDEFELYLQPQINSDNKITGAETLIRWNHPEKGIVGPNDFIPMTLFQWPRSPALLSP